MILMSSLLNENEILNMIKRLDIPQNLENSQQDEQEASRCLSIQNNVIWYIEPEGEKVSGPQRIKAEAPVVLYRNGERMQGEFAVTAEDHVDWTVDHQPLFDIIVAENKMRVWLQLRAKMRHPWRLVDKEETNHLIVEAEPQKEEITESVCVQDVLEVLSSKGIKLPVDRTCIELELELPTFEPVLLVEGVEPVDGTDARLELMFSEHIESSYEEVNGVVDFRNHLRIPSVQAGEVIARKIQPLLGTNGINVYGKVLPAREPKDLILIAKQNVKITPEHEVIALREGRPRVTGDRIKFIDMTSCHVVAGDVDLESGNIIFSGDVLIYGSIQDGMIVEALGNVYVHGHVFNATITATGSIHVKGNVIGSKLYSGYYGVLYNRLYSGGNRLNEQLQTFKLTAKQLIDMAAKAKRDIQENQAYQMVMENKFPEIPKVTKDLLACITTIQLIQKEHYSELRKKLQMLLSPGTFRLEQPYRFITELQQILIETNASIQRCEETMVVTDIPQCQLSTILCNGDILIRREGVIQSQLSSKNNIIFYEQGSVCRGSQVEAGQVLSAMIVGGVSGGESVLKAGHKLMVSKMYGGRIFVGRYSKEIMEPIENAQFYVSGEHLRMKGGVDELGDDHAES